MKLIRISATFLVPLLYAAFIANAQESQSSYVTPDAVSASIPDYPWIARRANISGTINVDIMVAGDGSVASAKAVDGHPLLAKVSESSALKWRFVPAQESSDMRPVRLAFTFRLMPEGTADRDLLPVFVTPYHVEIRETSYVHPIDRVILGKTDKRRAKVGNSRCKRQR
jgi:hypothetical protein